MSSSIPTIYDDDYDTTMCKKAPVKITSQQQFSFEDGTALQDYPASVDLEVAGKDAATQKANIIGYCDIYSSQILQTVPSGQITSSATSDEGGNNHLKPIMPHEALKKHNDMESTKSFHSMDLVIPQVIVEEPGRYYDEEQSSTSLKEAQDLLTKSVTDLLEMTEAMTIDDDSDHNNNEEEEEIM